MLHGRNAGHKNDLRTEWREDERLELLAEGPEVEQSDYDVPNLFIPYGPGWTAKRIEKLIYEMVRRLQGRHIIWFNLS